MFIQPLPIFNGLGKKLMASSTLEEDGVTYCLQQYGGIHDKTSEHNVDYELDRSAQLDAVEALSQQVQGVLSQRLSRHRGERDVEEEDGFEFTAELTGFSPPRSVSSVLHKPTPPIPGLGTATTHPPSSHEVNKRNKSLLQHARSLNACQNYNENGTKQGASFAEKYRLSFVDFSDSSSEEENECTKRSYPLSEPITVSRDNVELPGKRRSGKYDRVVHTMENDQVLKVDPEQSIGECAGLQCIAPVHNHCSLVPPANYSLILTMPLHQHCNNSNIVVDSSCLEYDDEGLKLLIPTSNGGHAKTNSQTNGHETSVLYTESTKTETIENGGDTVQKGNKAIRCIDHASFSPLYMMSVSQLQNIIKLLETKLQGK